MRVGVALTVAALLGALPARAAAQAAAPSACEPLRADLAESFAMAVEAEPESMDDARTGRTLPGCRITAAGGTALPESL